MTTSAVIADERLWEGTEPTFRFACPQWCSMRNDPTSHSGFAERNLGLVLHYGPNGG